MRAAELEDQVAGGTMSAENQLKSHDLNYGRPRENATTAM
jgi:hypothetical protein